MYFALTEFKGEWVSSTPEIVGPTDSRYSKVLLCFEQNKEYQETNKAWGRTTTTYYKVAITAPPPVQEIEEIQEIEEYQKSDFLLRQEREIEEYKEKEYKEKEWMEANISASFMEEARKGLLALKNVEQSILDQYLVGGFPLLSMVDIENGKEGDIPPYGVKTLGDIPPNKRIVLWAETPTKKALKGYRQIYAPDWGAYLPDDFPLGLDVWIEDPDIPVNTAYTCEQAYAVHRDKRFSILGLIPFRLKKPWVKTNYPYHDSDSDGRSPFGCRWDG